MPSHHPERIPALVPSTGDRLITLLARLLHCTEGEIAANTGGGAREKGARSPLTGLEASGVISRRPVASPRDLAGHAERAICMAGNGTSLLLENAGGGLWSVETGDGSAARLVRPSALQGLFPCEIVVERNPRVAGATDDAAHPARRPRLPKVAVYLRLVAQVLGLSTPIAMMLIIDKVVTQGAQNTLIALLVGVALLTVFQYLFQLAHALHAAREAEALALPARQGVLESLLASTCAPAWSSVGWDVIQSSAESGRFAVETRPQFAADCLYVVLLSVLMASFSPVLLLVSLAFVPAYVVVQAWADARAERHAAGATPLRSRIYAHYFEAVAAADLIHAMQLRDHVAARWTDLERRLAGTKYRLALCRRLSALGVEFLQKVSLILIMLLGVSSVIAGAMTLGQYIAFNLLSMQLAQPVLRLAAYRRARADHRLQGRSRAQLEDACRQRTWPPSGEAKVAAGESLVVEVDALEMAQGQRRTPAFVLRQGLWLGITGPSGCGKTTLLRCLSGLEEPHHGRVLMNGLPLRQLEHRSRARLVRLVPQDAVVFSASIAENIRLGDLAASPRQILTAAAVCGLSELLERLPDHLNTVVGQAGRTLSGGERQRIAIARAIISRPRILLLDEATAALDAKSEAELLANVRHFLPEAAVVIVSHRPSSLAGCRQVLRLGELTQASPQDGRARAAVAGVA